MSARRIPGPAECAARALPLERASKRRHVATVLGRLVDERGTGEIPIRTLAARCKRHRMEIVLAVEKLVAEGHVELIRRGDRNRQQTSIYAINTNTEKENNMTPTKPKSAPTEAAAAALSALDAVDQRPSRPILRRNLFPGPLRHIAWPELDAAREGHVKAIESFEAADDEEARRDALIAVADAVIQGDEALRRSFDAAQERFREEAAKVSPYGHNQRVPEAEREAVHAAIRRAREEWVDADGATLRGIYTLLTPDTFVDENSGVVVPVFVAEAHRVKQVVGA